MFLTAILSFLLASLSIGAAHFPDVFDYVVVGAGASGCVVASRLSENPSVTVLLLEAGEEPNLVSEIPGFFERLQLGKYDWNYRSTSQKYGCYGETNQRCRLPQGKGLGGTGIINYMTYTRGNKRDYDFWAENGAPGWDWESVLPYFKKSEDNRDRWIVENGFHGVGGEWTVESRKYYNPLVDAYKDAFEEFGYKFGDHNGPYPSVFNFPQKTTRNHRRWTTYKAFVEPIIGRKNFALLTSAYATQVPYFPDVQDRESFKKLQSKQPGYRISRTTYTLEIHFEASYTPGNTILFDKNNRAVGVEFYHCNKTRRVSVLREVIVSAGAMKSPQLLMLSGIGPREQLEFFNIPVVADLPVGKNFHDHAGTGALTFTIDKPFTELNDRTTKEDILQFLTDGTGRLSLPLGIEVIAYVNSKFNKNHDWPDVEIVFFSKTFTPGTEEEPRYCEPWKKCRREDPANDTLTCLTGYQQPKSRGEIRLKSTNPFEDPIIDPNFFSDPYDMKIVVEGMKICLGISETESMRRLGARPSEKRYAECERFPRFSEPYLECLARIVTYSFYHFGGSCKMGHPSDVTTVVDPTLRVIGVKGLRVADASIMPTIPTAHTYAAAVMIGEKAADMICGDNSRI